jgi:peptidoglycan hydrolase-like protein with peptidoglycan-binding domain
MTTRRPVPALLLCSLLLAAGMLLPLAPANAAASSGWSLRSPLARETVSPGARDTDVYHIAHVRELQLRLGRLGLFSGPVDGVFGHRTARAVRQFKKKAGLRITSTMGHAAWAGLIRRTTHTSVPKRCLRGGWHMCVDRLHHEASLFHAGVLYNSWLVRTGAAGMETRRGSHLVYWRDADHVSSSFGSAMPYAQFFDGGQALHGSPYMTDPYVGHSHGCVNFYLEDARQLWRLTSSKRLVVTVHGAWD